MDCSLYGSPVIDTNDTDELKLFAGASIQRASEEITCHRRGAVLGAGNIVYLFQVLGLSTLITLIARLRTNHTRYRRLVLANISIPTPSTMQQVVDRRRGRIHYIAFVTRAHIAFVTTRCVTNSFNFTAPSSSAITAVIPTVEFN